MELSEPESSAPRPHLLLKEDLMTPALVAALPAFALYTFIQAITPGPANLCSLATTMRIGVRPALRQWVGLTIGFFAVMAVAMAALLGATSLIEGALPALTVAGAAYVLWLAWSMVRPGEGHGFNGVQPTIGAGVVLQVTNVKLLVMSSTALVAYVIPYTSDLAVLAAIGFAVPIVGSACNLAWIYGGVHLQAFYERHRRPVDAVMAAALALCAAGMLAALV